MLKNLVSWICPSSPFWKLGSLAEVCLGFHLLCHPQSLLMGFLCSCLQVCWISWDLVCLGIDVICLKQSGPLLCSLTVDVSFPWIISTLKTVHLHVQDTILQNYKTFPLRHSALFYLPQVLDLYLLCSMFCFRSNFQNHFALRIFAKPIKWFLGFTIWCMTWSKKKKKKEHRENMQYRLWFRGIRQKCPLCLHHSLWHIIPFTALSSGGKHCISYRSSERKETPFSIRVLPKATWTGGITFQTSFWLL